MLGNIGIPPFNQLRFFGRFRDRELEIVECVVEEQAFRESGRLLPVSAAEAVAGTEYVRHVITCPLRYLHALSELGEILHDRQGNCLAASKVTSAVSDGLKEWPPQHGEQEPGCWGTTGLAPAVYLQAGPPRFTYAPVWIFSKPGIPLWE